MSRRRVTRVQRLQSLAFVVRAPRGLAVDGDEVVAAGPECSDPAFETSPEENGIDAVDKRAQPAFAGNAEMECREAPQKIQMMRAPPNQSVQGIMPPSQCKIRLTRPLT